MTTQNNDVLGYITCEAGNRASVHQAKRGKGKFLYTRCDCCGCDQRTGAAFQTKLFNNTQWLGEKPNPPSVVNTTESQPKKAVVEPEENEDFNPKEPVVQPKTEPSEEPNGSFGLVAAIGAGLGLIGFLLSRATK